MSDEELQSKIARAEDSYEALKDRVHDLYDENKDLKEEVKRLTLIHKVQTERIQLLMKRLEKRTNKIDEAKNKIQYIIDYGYDYDGFEKSESLKGLIDLLVDYARQAKEILEGKNNE